MNITAENGLEQRLKQCVERMQDMQRAMAELSCEISEIAGLIGATDCDDWRDGMAATLRRQKAEIAHLRSGRMDEASKVSANPAHPYPFRLDARSREARVGRRRIPLTPQEFKLIECLWEETPEFVTRDFLLTRLHGDTPVKSKRLIDVHISNIRTKLRNAGATDVHIDSKSGSGWRLAMTIDGDDIDPKFVE